MNERVWEFVIRASTTTVVSLGLLKIFYTAQTVAETKGKPRVFWIHFVFWLFWTFAFFICIGLLVLIVWAGISMCRDGDTKGAATMLFTTLLVAPGVYFLFIYPLIKRRKDTLRNPKKQ